MLDLRCEEKNNNNWFPIQLDIFNHYNQHKKPSSDDFMWFENKLIIIFIASSIILMQIISTLPKKKGFWMSKK